MTARNYEVIAAIIREEMEANRNEDRGYQAAYSIAVGLADYFAKTNPRFDRAKFYAAVGIT